MTCNVNFFDSPDDHQAERYCVGLIFPNHNENILKFLSSREDAYHKIGLGSTTLESQVKLNKLVKSASTNSMACYWKTLRKAMFV
jgi:hypothetical protein